jgi:hypothetical protein
MMVDVVARRAVVVVAHGNDIPAEYFLQGLAVNAGGRVHVDVPVDAKHVLKPSGDET